MRAASIAMNSPRPVTTAVRTEGCRAATRLIASVTVWTCASASARATAVTAPSSSISAVGTDRPRQPLAGVLTRRGPAVGRAAP